MNDDEVARLFDATQATRRDWKDRLMREAADEFPENVTAFREGMAVYGRHEKPCPACGAPVHRIAYAENAAHDCPRCQTAGKLLTDRSLSRLMHGDWPKTLDELQARMRARPREAAAPAAPASPSAPGSPPFASSSRSARGAARRAGRAPRTS